jgi:fido (protein-threonine AMPylation protein)
MDTVLSRTFGAKGWPNWRASIGRARVTTERLDFTIKMDSKTRAYSSSENPEALFKQAIDCFEDIQQMMRDSGPAASNILQGTLRNDMVNVIFGSNAIERAGLGLEETIRICEAIFRGEDVDANDVPDRCVTFEVEKTIFTSSSNPQFRSPEYEGKLISAIHSKLPLSHVIRSRREVIQHAKALQYIVSEMVEKNQLLSEEIIMSTHRILCSDIDIEGRGELGGISAKVYAGRYRTIQVAAGSTNFVNPKFIPKKMAELVEEFNQDIARAEESGVLDPFSLAAKYCSDFVMIHPFADGNGRTCRLILNAILLKYAGIVVPIGEHDGDRAEYIEAQRKADEMEGNGELSSLVLKKAWVRYRALRKKMNRKSGSTEKK